MPVCSAAIGFADYRFNAFRRAAAYLSEIEPFARNGLSLARNGFRFHGLHSGVNGPGLLLRYLVLRFKMPVRPFGSASEIGLPQFPKLPRLRPVAFATG